MYNLELISVLSRAFKCETGYVRRYFFALKSIILFLQCQHFYVSPYILYMRLKSSPKTLGKGIKENINKLEKYGYANVRNLIDRNSKNILRLHCKTLLAKLTTSQEFKQIICKNDYWCRLNNSWEESEPIKNLLKTSPKLSELLMRYIGPTFCLSQYDYIYVPSGWDGSTSGSRGWHIDNHHLKVVKLFIPVHKITKEHGATCLLNPKHSQIYTNYHPLNMPDNEILKLKNRTKNPITVLEMNEEDAFIVDTSRCLHMGGRSAKSRLFVVLTFTGVTCYCKNWPRNLDNPKVRSTLLDVNRCL